MSRIPIQIAVPAMLPEIGSLIARGGFVRGKEARYNNGGLAEDVS